VWAFTLLSALRCLLIKRQTTARVILLARFFYVTPVVLVHMHISP
jgi:hypothetical protein